MWGAGRCSAVLTAAILAALSLISARAFATYSVAAIDLARGEIGAAGTSCLGGQDVAVIYRAVPGIGVVIAQAHYNAATHQRGVELLARGYTPEEVLLGLTALESDADAELRQYAVVDVMGRVAHFTGQNTDRVALSRAGEAEYVHFSAQGNLLSDEAVVHGSAEAMSQPSCDLAERLLRALEAGGSDGQGDSRCTGSGIPGDSAFLEVATTSGEPLISLSVPSSGRDDPLLALRSQLSSLRAEHPCEDAKPATRAAASAAAGCAMASLPRASIHAAYPAAVALLLLATLAARRPR